MAKLTFKRKLQILSTLEFAYHLLDSRKNWTQGAYARNRHNEPIAPTSNEAVCWCAIGAVGAASGNRLGVESRLARESLAIIAAANGLKDPDAIAHANDIETYGEVRKLFRRAISALKRDVKQAMA